MTTHIRLENSFFTMVRPRRRRLQHVLSLVTVLAVIGIFVGCARSEPTIAVEESCLATDEDTSEACSSFPTVEEDDNQDFEEQMPKDVDEYDNEYEYVDGDDEEYEDEDDEEEEDQDEAKARTKNTVPISWGLPQVVEGENSEMTLKVMDETRQYMTQKVFVEDEFKLIRRVCTNDNELCSLWSALGTLAMMWFGVMRTVGKSGPVYACACQLDSGSCSKIDRVIAGTMRVG
jgi:hypothetical protein